VKATAATVGLVALLAGCSPRSDTTEQADSDAPSDVAITDAGSDARTGDVRPGDAGTDRDATPEASAEAGPPDAPEGSANADYDYPGQWTTIPDPPEGCDVQISLTPATAVPALEWKPCANERAGCARYTADWNLAAQRRPFSSAWWVDPLVVNDEPRFEIARHFYHGEREHGYVLGLQSLTGPATYVVAVKLFGEYGAYCVNSMGFGAEGVYQKIAYLVDDKLERTWFTSADWSDPFTMRNVNGLSQEWLGGGVNGLFPHQGRLFVTMRDDNWNSRTVVVDPDVPKVYPENAADGALPLGDPKLVKDGALMQVEFGNSLYVMNRDGISRKVLASRPGHTMTMFDVDHGADDTIVWMEAKESFTGGLSEFSLWVSPYAASEAAVVKRQVAQFPEGVVTGLFIANAGAVAMITKNEHEGRIIRVSDGAWWKVPADPDMYLNAPLWVDDHAVWFLTQTNLEATGDATNGVIRIDRSTLGEPTMANDS
jgi:hypothetical protein